MIMPTNYFPSLAYSISPLENFFHTSITVWSPESRIPGTFSVHWTHSKQLMLNSRRRVNKLCNFLQAALFPASFP